MKIRPLRKPMRRRLSATDRHGRPYSIEIAPEGVISVWPRRLPREQTSIESVYQRAVVLRKAEESAQLRKVKNGTAIKSSRR